ncbi:MAG TPA: thiamine pyrophosphate-dependent dehydrogenase E1 component subunit alpha [Acidimicrobiales bacterium]|nr:thiamine pyrophosphate-dependent dehydrogenase E1 component subunit alpha [Acidimicrobiales bacterium]
MSQLDLREAHRCMVLSRAFEDRLRKLFTSGGLRGRLVTGHGQEAIPIGSAMALGPRDCLAPLHRDLGAHFVRGTQPVALLRQYLGRVTSPSRGRDGDVHVGEWERGVFPMVSHLPDSWPVMGGVALAMALEGEGRVAMAYCGDGATSTGTWHESVNFAAVERLPIVYIVEDNQYAYSTPTEKQYRVERISDRAAGYGIAGTTVDGNDVEAVFDACREAVDRARAGEGPTLVECVTMRMEGHAIHDDASYVPPEVLEEWRSRDPLDRLEARLLADGVTRRELDEVRDAARAEVLAALEIAQSEPMPDGGDVELGVYAPLPATA